MTLANAVDGAVENHRRDHAIKAQASNERGGLAMAVREAHPKPLALAATAMGARHIRRRPGLIDEHEPFRIEVRLRLEPVAALLQDVRAVLLDRVPGLFFRVTPWRWKNRDRLDVDVAMPRAARRSQSSSSV